MRHSLIAAMCFSFSVAAGAAQAAPQPEAEAKVVNIAEHFAAFWDANQALPRDVQVQKFKEQFAPRFPGFYDIARFDGDRTQEEQDKRIAQAIEGFPAIRALYLQKARQFNAELPRYKATFKTWFPDYRQTEDVYVTHSLGEMDGGARRVDGRLYLVFGVDGMVKYHGDTNESPFFMHELFHMHHMKAMKGCAANKVWESLWMEGLASYVSKAMNPTATEEDMQLNIPDGMAAKTRAVLPAAFAQLESVLDSEDGAVRRSLFQTRGEDLDGLPKRRGYYLGYLVAEEAAKTHHVSKLASMSCSEARSLVESTVRQLRSRYQPATASR